MNVRVPDNLVALGSVLDVVVERDGRRERLEPGGPQWLCADASKETLWLLPKKTVPGRLPDGADAEIRRMGSVYRQWNDFEPRRTQLTPPLTVRGKWRLVGRVVRMGYRSDKWDARPNNYEHDFGRARLVRLGPLYRIAGGVKVTSRGIVG